jgi:hypothetical protein
MTEAAKERAIALRKTLKYEMQRKPSLSEAEAFMLHGLLIDSQGNVRENSAQSIEQNEGDSSSRQLSDEILFSLPPPNALQKEELPAHHKPAKRRSTLGLWRAHEEGVLPQILKVASRIMDHDSIAGKEIVTGDTGGGEATSISQDQGVPSADVDNEDIASDVEVRPLRPDSNSDASSASSWDENEHQDNYDTWEVLKDEYAGDFGFDYGLKGSLESIMADDDTVGNSFSILGTSASDPSVQPHVLSPPLMDAIVNFLPVELEGQNFWLRYSLVRDGASLDTMRDYVKGAHYTILAIETPEGEVFGSFTSSPWRTNLGYFGSKPSFVWKMRHNRRSKCSSLFEQAQLESEIDVYMCTHKKDLIQVCRRDQLAIGGDELPDNDEKDIKFGESGFAFSLESDLLFGTTSPCKSFTSPALVGQGDRSHVFNVAGLEVWSFTPCFDIPSAQKLEMTKFFLEQSLRSTQSGSTRSTLSANDILSERFYQRVGQDFDSQERRNRWQYTNMMNPVGPRTGFQSSPRFT